MKLLDRGPSETGDYSELDNLNYLVHLAELHEDFGGYDSPGLESTWMGAARELDTTEKFDEEPSPSQTGFELRQVDCNSNGDARDLRQPLLV